MNRPVWTALFSLGSLLLIARSVAGCAEPPYTGGTCGGAAIDCTTSYNYGGGTVCKDGPTGPRCECPESWQAKQPCCPGGGTCEKAEDFKCRPATECEPREAEEDAGADAPPDAPPEEPPPECEMDADCADKGPPDPRCGVPLCLEGVCAVEVYAGEPIESQFPGDCEIVICDLEGALMRWDDPSDIPRDGNACTFDTCEGGKPDNIPVPDKSPCADKDYGICLSGKCQDCASDLNITYCPIGLVCDWDTCVPPTCNNNVINMGETGMCGDCGGPCAPCLNGDKCLDAVDCQSHVCGVSMTCEAATHSDGQHNDGETGVDCGYPDGPLNDCLDGDGCLSGGNCVSKVCYQGVCQAPSCFDAIQNGSEVGEDCGGECKACLK